MFRIDRDKLKERVEANLSMQFITLDYQLMTVMPTLQTVVDSINNAIEANRLNTLHAMHDLIDQLYDENDFEKDIGLR